MKRRIIFLTLLATLMSACTIVPATSDTTISSNPTESSDSSFDSESETSSHSSTESSSESSSNQTSTSDVISSSSESETPSTSVDEGTSEPGEETLKMYNGFEYPSNAQTKVTAEYVEFWHPDTKITINISATPQIFAYMDTYGYGYSNNYDNRYQDLYWPVDVDLTINGRVYHYEEVGMRRKGNTSRSYNFMDNGKVSDAFSFKLSFNEVWDEEVYAQFGLKKSWLPTDPAYIERDDRTIIPDANGKGGLDKIDIKMFKTDDKSMVNQPFAFNLFQKYGLISPNSTLANIKFKSGTATSDMGVATINEPIDKDLLKRYFTKDNAKGDLYKVGWGYGDKGNLKYEQYLQSPGMIDEEDKLLQIYPRYDAKEFDAKAAEPHKNLVNLMKVLYDNQNKTPSQYAANLEAVIDIDSFLMFAALSYLTGNQDDMRNNGNNYYIYFNPGENNKAYFIPYDYDWALGLGWDDNGGLNMANLSPFHSKLQGNGRNAQDNRLFYYTIIDNKAVYNITTNTTWKQSYYDKITSIINGNFYTLNTFNDLFNRYKNNYKNDINVLKKHSGEVYNGFYGTDTFSAYLSAIKNSVNTYRS